MTVTCPTHLPFLPPQVTAVNREAVVAIVLQIIYQLLEKCVSFPTTFPSRGWVTLLNPDHIRKSRARPGSLVVFTVNYFQLVFHLPPPGRPAAPICSPLFPRSHTSTISVPCRRNGKPTEVLLSKCSGVTNLCVAVTSHDITLRMGMFK